MTASEIETILSGGDAPHAATHENGGADEINVGGLSGLLADTQHPIIGAGATEAVAGNDARLTNARTPTAHAATHAAGGGDSVTITEAQVTGLAADLAARVVGPAGATDGHLAVFDGVTGKIVKDGGVPGAGFVPTTSQLVILAPDVALPNSLALSQFILRDTRANQAGYAGLPQGALYYVTDEGVLEFYTGAAWLSFSSAGAAPGFHYACVDVSKADINAGNTVVAKAAPGAGLMLRPIAISAEANLSATFAASPTWALKYNTGGTTLGSITPTITSTNYAVFNGAAITTVSVGALFHPSNRGLDWVPSAAAANGSAGLRLILLYAIVPVNG